MESLGFAAYRARIGKTVNDGMLSRMEQKSAKISELENKILRLRAENSSLRYEHSSALRLLNDIAQNKNSAAKHSLDRVLQEVCRYYGIAEDAICGNCKDKPTSNKRQVFMYLAKVVTNRSSTEIGRRINKDHTSVIKGMKRMAGRCAKSPKLGEDILMLKNILLGEKHETISAFAELTKIEAEINCKSLTEAGY